MRFLRSTNNNAYYISKIYWKPTNHLILKENMYSLIPYVPLFDRCAYKNRRRECDNINFYALI